MASISIYTKDALAHMHYLVNQIGGRGSCTVEERQAGEYTADQMHLLGLKEVSSQPFRAIPSTYWPYALSFTIAGTGSALIALLNGYDVLILGTILNFLGAWGMLAETEFAPSWTHWVLPRAPSQNVTGLLPARGERQKRVVLCAHIDTHRTPVFYSSNTWYALFSILVGLAFLSMLVGFILYGLAVWQGWTWLRIPALLFLLIQASGAVLCIHADFTAYTPGANDNASGVGVALALAKRLRKEPLGHTEVQVAITGCEEVGDYGINTFLDAQAASLRQDTLFIILDEMGLGVTKFLTSDGLLLKHRTHPKALALARQVRSQNPELRLMEGPGMAYTDALPATKRGLMALTVCSLPEPGSTTVSHWHQMSDTLEHVNPDDLENALQFTWKLLQCFDASTGQ
jgi:hypothetical protein